VPVFSFSDRDYEVALFIDSQIIGAVEDQPDFPRIRSGR
jgi:hypothetical protein